MIANKRQINSSWERYVTAITYLTKAMRYGIICDKLNLLSLISGIARSKKIRQIIKNCPICSNICLTIRKSCLLRIV